MHLLERTALVKAVTNKEHGHGKASAMLHFMQYLERKHPDLAEEVVDALDTNLLAMSEPEILAMARGWFEDHQP